MNYYYRPSGTSRLWCSCRWTGQASGRSFFFFFFFHLGIIILNVFSKMVNTFVSFAKKRQHRMSCFITCSSTDVIYLLTCLRGLQYIGSRRWTEMFALVFCSFFSLCGLSHFCLVHFDILLYLCKSSVKVFMEGPSSLPYCACRKSLCLSYRVCSEELDDINKQISSTKQQLHCMTTEQDFEPLKTSLDSTITKHCQDICKIKLNKFKRDTLDYRDGWIYPWLYPQSRRSRFAPHTTSVSSASDITQ